jgi:hypothetical protein
MLITPDALLTPTKIDPTKVRGGADGAQFSMPTINVPIAVMEASEAFQNGGQDSLNTSNATTPDPGHLMAAHFDINNNSNNKSSPGIRSFDFMSPGSLEISSPVQEGFKDGQTPSPVPSIGSTGSRGHRGLFVRHGSRPSSISELLTLRAVDLKELGDEDEVIEEEDKRGESKEDYPENLDDLSDIEEMDEEGENKKESSVHTGPASREMNEFDVSADLKKIWTNSEKLHKQTIGDRLDIRTLPMLSSIDALTPQLRSEWMLLQAQIYSNFVFDQNKGTSAAS